MLQICRIMVGENGRVWIDGSADGVSLARHALHAVSKEAHSKDMDEILNEIENKKKGDA